MGISGLGWCLDFGIYLALTLLLELPVQTANHISTIPAVTLVFFLSTRHTFRQRPGGLPLWVKYLLYVVYQLLLVAGVSWLGQQGYDLLIVLPLPALILDSLKILIKIGITPITMLLNYFVLGWLTERL